MSAGPPPGAEGAGPLRNASPDVTIVIPCSRGRPAGLDGWRGQSGAPRVLLLCNGGYDGADVVGLSGVDVRRVAWKGHGRTRQAALADVATPFVLFTVDDAVPVGCDGVVRLIDALEAGGWDAVTARQVPPVDADAVTRARLAAWTPEGEGPVATDRLDHVCALHRVEVLRTRPLPDVPIAEDWAWAQGWQGPGRVRAGDRPRLGYAPAARVVHGHVRTFRSLLRRTAAEHGVRVACGESPAVPDVRRLLAALPGVLGPDVRGALGELLGQWWAGRRVG
ncbi:MAG: hypothetical protein RLZZ299_1600 [Pseudomonadota bacterium]